MPKKRLDTLITERGLTENRSKARAIILAGDVIVGKVKVEKSGTLVDVDSEITIKKKAHDYVSRGGIKLAHALSHFEIDPEGKICADVGASTGGFTDCLLKRGAVKVWALDSGTNQLHYSLRADERVVSLEKTNVKEMDISVITDDMDIMVADVSFISLRLVIPPLLSKISPGGELALLVKPQFEAGREKVGKGGIVRDIKVHKEVIEGLKDFFENAGLIFRAVCESPIKGAKGNVEYFLHFQKGGTD